VEPVQSPKTKGFEETAAFAFIASAMRPATQREDSFELSRIITFILKSKKQMNIF
jgi:hypothetical protein